MDFTLRNASLNVSVCCVGFASLGVVCDELHNCACNFGLLFNMCSAVIVVLCFVPVLRGCVCCYIQKKAILLSLCND